MHLPGNAYVQPIELRWKWPNRAITRYRLWPVRLLVLYVALSSSVAAGAAGTAGFVGGLVGAAIAGFFILAGAARLLSTEREIERETASSNSTTNNCPGCGRPIDGDAAACSSCSESKATGAAD